MHKKLMYFWVFFILVSFGCSGNIFKRTKSEDKPILYTVTNNQVKLGWEYDKPSDILGFEIERKAESDAQFKQIAIVGPNATSYTDTGLIYGTTYIYRLRAFDSKFKTDYTREIIIKIVAK